MSRGRLRIGIDTGGTFTDVVALDAVSGEVHTTKTPSTPHDPSVGFAEGVRLILEQIGATIDEVDTVSHGTTVATNALLQDNVADLGLLTTEGFRDILEIARQSVPDGYGNSYSSPVLFPEPGGSKHLVLMTYEGPVGVSLEGQVLYGASPRASMGIDRAARAHAWLAGRDFVGPEDIQAIAFDVLRHRIVLSFEAEADGVNTNSVIQRILDGVGVP